ncbi:MAG: hypothetical protein R3F59_26255 [Myxococcota bacterium]
MIVTLLAACTFAITREGTLVVDAQDVSQLGTLSFPGPMLRGTRTCPAVQCTTGCGLPMPQLLSCYDLGVAGPGSLGVGPCFTFDSQGAVTWTFTPRACAVAGFDPVPDTITFPVVTAATVSPSVVEYEGLAEAFLHPDPAIGHFPPRWRHVPQERWQLAGPFQFTVALLRATDLSTVGFSLADQALDVEGSPEVTAVTRGRAIEVTAPPGRQASLQFRVGAATWQAPVARVIGVSPDDAASLQVVVGYFEASDGDLLPAGARAIVRDDAGDLVWGAPVVWSLDAGLLALDGSGMPGADYVQLSGACVDPATDAGHHDALLRATLQTAGGTLTATAPLSWDSTPDPADPGFTPDPTCVEGHPPDTGGSGTTTGTPPDTGAPEPTVRAASGRCGGCSSAGATGWLLAPLLAGLWSRRRGMDLPRPRA